MGLHLYEPHVSLREPVVMLPYLQPTWYRSLRLFCIIARRFLLSLGPQSNSGTFNIAVLPTCRTLTKCFLYSPFAVTLFLARRMASFRASVNFRRFSSTSLASRPPTLCPTFRSPSTHPLGYVPPPGRCGEWLVDIPVRGFLLRTKCSWFPPHIRPIW